EMLHDELRQEVPKLWRLGLIPGRVVPDRLCPADVVDPDDQRFDVRVQRLGPEVQPQQAKGKERDKKQGNFQVRVHHQGGAVDLHKLPLRVVERVRRQVGNNGGHGYSYQSGWKWKRPAIVQITPIVNPMRAATPNAIR